MAIRAALPIGPCPWKFGKKEEMSDAALELADGSWVYVGGCAVNVANVEIACLYAREASNACSESA